ncbi:hypothetical protein GCM10010123_18090 [Pilimelia anulata]|uniref:Uncharacterized protein n=1 Tax=Pilimelia anulata TaxID=53371 RepID=A0A8J3B2B6_9ACTN|nr:hypothetical protein [Pilimelia anulata]GGJ88876.1 hypothetical protein GCM10010123_18090 [Pilimelia anulata]
MHPTQKPATGTVVYPSDLLRAAAGYLAAHGWIQHGIYRWTLTPGDWRTTNPAASLLGAIAAAASTDDTPTMGEADYARLGAALDWLSGWLAFHHTGYSHLLRAYTIGDLPSLDRVLVDFNDTPGRTAADIVSALHTAAADWDRLHRGVTA